MTTPEAAIGQNSAAQAARSLAERIAQEEEAIRRALLDGRDTTAARAKLASLRDEAVRMARQAAAVEAERQRANDERIASLTMDLARESARRLLGRLAALAPPPRPWGVPDQAADGARATAPSGTEA